MKQRSAKPGSFAMKSRVIWAAAALFILPAAVQAQGVVRGAQEGAAVGNRAAGPVGGAVGAVGGGVVGGVAGGVKGVLGIPQQSGVRRTSTRKKARSAGR
jgi:hypothetical protein